MRRGRILVVEDDPSVLLGLEAKLRLEGHHVGTAADGEAALRKLEDEPWDLLILDLMLPCIDGLGLLEWLRRRSREMPVLIVSARGSEREKVDGLRAGADDYLAKPFGLAELIARVEALLRRARGGARLLRVGPFTLDLESEQVLRGRKAVLLSPKEAAILFHLARHAGRAVSREEIQSAVWGYFASSAARAVDYHVLHLRRKLEEDPTSPSRIVTRHGRGYELIVEPGG